MPASMAVFSSVADGKQMNYDELQSFNLVFNITGKHALPPFILSQAWRQTIASNLAPPYSYAGQKRHASRRKDRWSTP